MGMGETENFQLSAVPYLIGLLAAPSGAPIAFFATPAGSNKDWGNYLEWNCTNAKVNSSSNNTKVWPEYHGYHTANPKCETLFAPTQPNQLYISQHPTPVLRPSMPQANCLACKATS
jgi:hypothetical protein